MSAWLMGMTPPSANPIIRRVTNNMANEVTQPDSMEAAEKINAAMTRISLRRPNTSDSRPTTSPASAQLSDSAEPSIPTCSFDRWSSGVNQRHQEIERVAIEVNDAEVETQ
jgi:hypothetical protein